MENPELRSEARTITETELVTITCLADLKPPIFIGDEYARNKGPHGGRIVPDFLTAPIVGRMTDPLMSERTIGDRGSACSGFTHRSNPEIRSTRA